MELSQAIISGAFGIGVAIVTWLLSGLRELGVSKREARKQKQEKLESLYAKTIAQLEMLLRLTESGDSYDQIKRELSDNNGMLRLLANEPVNSQLEKTSGLIYSWSTLYRKGAPKKMGGDMAMITSEDSKYSQQAKDLYPEVNQAIVELIGLMKTHIAAFDNA
ncbi:hypothetical protein [Halomonas tibetensis]|uniref:DUF2489 domain-containing protein n=1 Tax=Halomonas tibetensis TaxID=2259590 RepID=A0ABV7B6Q2_9GAMM